MIWQRFISWQNARFAQYSQKQPKLQKLGSRSVHLFSFQEPLTKLNTTQHNKTEQYCVVRHGTVHAVDYFSWLHHTTAQHNSVQYSTAEYSTVQHMQYSTAQYILVMQCFRVGYLGICHASLLFSVYTRTFRRVCIRRKYKWQVACSAVSHEKASHNYFIPCLNLRKSSEIFGKLRKWFKSNFYMFLWL